MPPPPKRKTEAAFPLVLPWHPNFRNYERLPDIKVVRTAFFVNMAAISIAVFIAAGVGYGEYQLNAIHEQISDVESRIAENTAASEQGIQLYKGFQEAESRINEIDAFVKRAMDPSPILLHLGKTLPRNIALNSFDLRDRRIILRGQVRGSPDQATGYANSYFEQLKKDSYLGEFIGEVTASGMSKHSQQERLNFELTLKFKTPQK